MQMHKWDDAVKAEDQAQCVYMTSEETGPHKKTIQKCERAGALSSSAGRTRSCYELNRKKGNRKEKSVEELAAEKTESTWLINFAAHAGGELELKVCCFKPG